MTSTSTETRAANYVSKVPPAAEPGRNDALNKLAFAVLERFDLPEAAFESILMDWADSCSPPIPESEARKTISSAWRGAHGKGVVGKKSSITHRGAATAPTHGQHHKNASKAKPAQQAYNLNAGAELPKPIDDGARLLIRSLFLPGEGVRIAPAKWSEEAGKELPDGGGICITREEWLKKLDSVNGNPNGIFSSTKRTGIYIAVNPYRVGCTKDADVSAYRHALVEFDVESGLSLSAQWDLYQKSRIPCAAITYSGGESIHAWVKIDAQNRQEYDDRVRILYQHFEGYHCDQANKNPGRLSRLPSCVRFDKRQELLAMNTGCESFTEWQAEIQADGIGDVFTIDDLDNFDAENDPNALLGKRWICKGGSLLIIGPSGIGKSSLVLQLVVPWCVNKPSFGIKPSCALKALFIQAENDEGDMAEMFRGIRNGLGIDPFSNEAEYEMLKRNLVFIRDTSHTGQAFTEAVRRLIDKHHPDLVVFDPLLSFIGADISRQEVCSQFLRSWLNPIASATGVAWICVHHTGKPPSDPKAKKHWKGSDFSYAGLGSSELTNWTRASMTIEQAGEGAYRVIMSKRGKRSGATHTDGSPAQTLWLRHSEKSIFWEQIAAPEEHKHDASSGRPSDVERVNAMNLSNFLTGCTKDGERLNEISKRLMGWLAEQNDDVKLRTCQRIIPRLVTSRKLKKTSEGLYVKGDNA